MNDVFAHPLKGVPAHQHQAFLNHVRDALIPRIKDTLFAGSSPGLLDVMAEVEDGVIKVRVVDLSSKDGPGEDERAFLNEKSPDEFYNTVTEDEFMARVMTAAREVTPRLYELFADAERAFR